MAGQEVETARHGEPIDPPISLFLDSRLAQLADVVPEAVTEGRLDLDRLREALGDIVEDGPERYTFSWAGKRGALQLLQIASQATLVPALEESVAWETTDNIFIEGENLDVLKLLYRAYFGRVRAIYIDPPYNTGADFIYPDDFSERVGTYLRVTGQTDEAGNLLTSNPETSGRYHSAWLSMMYPRLFLARQLLRDDGVIFVSVDDHELDNLRLIMNEIFGEENRIENFVWKKSYGGGAKERYAVTQHEYVLMYARRKEAVESLWLPPNPETERRYYKGRDEKFETRGPFRLQPLGAARSLDARENLRYAIPHEEYGEIWPDYQWLWERDRTLKALANDELVFSGKDGEVTVSYKQYLRDEAGKTRGEKPTSVIEGIYTQHGTQELTDLFDGVQVMQYPKPVALLKRLVSMATDPASSDIVLDFFAGSCTTAHAVMDLNREDAGNRRFVMVQLPEPTPEGSAARQAGLDTIAQLGRERIKRAAAKIAETDNGNGARSDDRGFKAFSFASSNFKPWPSIGGDDVDSYSNQLELHTTQLVDNALPDAILWEVAMREGLSLNSRLETVELEGTNNVLRLIDLDREQTLYVCLDEQVDAGIARSLGLTREDTFICREAALDDTLAANLELQCHLKTV
jgi:adenine-specific DNA-methyltransferase